MDQDFYSVAIPEPTTIMGLRLRPLSLGHVILLHRVRSSFVCEQEEPTLHDLALSVLICSLPFKDGCELFNSQDLPKFFTRWHDKLTGNSWLVKLGLRKAKPFDYTTKAIAFADYIRRGSSLPNYSFDPSDFQSMACPSVQLVKVALMRHLGIPESELMDRSWSLCLWDYVTIRAMDGQVKMVDVKALREAQELADQLGQKLGIRHGNS